MATLFDGIEANGFSTGFAMGNQIKRQRGLASGMARVAQGDNGGWQEIAENAPELYLRQKQFEESQKLANKRLEQTQNGGAWTTDLGRMYSIAHDPNASPEDRKIANNYLQFNARDPMANQNWTQAGRIGQLQGDLSLAGQVEAEKTLAREKAQNASEIEKKAENLKRNMPSFYEMADELISLADKATYTKAGRLRNAILREFDQPMSEGGKAREKYDEIVKNELLPKLRETFGGQLSDSEREALLGTLGNVNLSPEEKKQAVRAFIESKERQLKSYGIQPLQEGVKVNSEMFSSMSDDDLLKGL